jgi:DNA adenine methylase
MNLDNLSPVKAMPFLRWPGGKRWLLPILRKLIGDYQPHIYIEPFLGGGALFFSLCPNKAILCDINHDLITTYKCIRNKPHNVIAALEKLPISKKVFNSFRISSNKDQLNTAIKFLYLNRTCFNGLYRVNRSGEFNVPYAGGTRTTSILYKTDILIRASKHLQCAKLLVSDFEEVIKSASMGDLIYCDPTYTVKHNNNGFRRYNEVLFSWDDQERLAKSCKLASKKGVRVVISNAYHKDILKLFNNFSSIAVDRKSCLSATPAFRSNVNEYIFYNC